ncbi:MAG TPA: TonB-dependent siderophore receptor [Opitutaceae bacterium]|nr:TonB-dependent siderophore receptor [Opitutaceae bacterium]
MSASLPNMTGRNIQASAPSQSGASRQASRIAVAAVAAVGILSSHSSAQEASVGSATPGAATQDPALNLPAVEVTGTADFKPHDIPQSIDTVSQREMSQQAVTTMQDVLRNVPGITINAGEGGSHGDSVNLRGLSVPDSFFLDGLRDIGLYNRDLFNEEAVEVLLGPSSVLFGRGSTAGVVNQVTKQASLTPAESATMEFGTAGFVRATGDVDFALGDHAAARLNVMDQRYEIADRNDVLIRSYGIAPTLAFGINTPTQLTLSYLHQYENDVPDYGIPFIDGVPAPVNRRNYYGLVNYDRTTTKVDIATARLEHRFSDHFSFINSARYGHYDFTYLLTAPHLDDDFTEVPDPGTPLADILVYRDQPSGSGITEEYIDRADLTSKFDFGSVTNILITGVELSRETTDQVKYINGLNVIPPASLLDPVDSFDPPTALDTDTLPSTEGSDVSLSAMDKLRLSAQWDIDAGIRWDRFNSHYSESTSGNAFSRDDTELSPKGAIIYKPNADDSIYASYGASYNPAIEYLSIAPSSDSLSPEKDYTTEIGTKLDFMNHTFSLTGAVFDTLLVNARQADPDDPTVQELPYDQRVLGFEIGAAGYLTQEIEVTASYTHLDDTISATTDAPALKKRVPNIASDSANLWLTWEPGRTWQLGGGATYMGQRYADTYNTATVPSYVVVNAMVSYHVNQHLDLQVNLNNIADTLYYNGIYYTEVDENHAVPGAGRTLLVTAKLRF